MSRYIDADKFIRWIDVGHLRSPSEICYCEDDVKGMIDMQPTADVVEVIRCKDCVFCTRTKDGEYNPEDIVCGYFMTDGMQANDFCSYGKRREEIKMSRDKQIEEMAEILYKENGHLAPDYYRPDAEALYNAGYRKASDVAREIFEEVKEAILDLVSEDIDRHWLYMSIAELKKKYESKGEGEG